MIKHDIDECEGNTIRITQYRMTKIQISQLPQAV